MTKSAETEALLNPVLGENDLQAFGGYGAAEPSSSFEYRHLAQILSFLDREIDQSAAMLRDLAARVSHELCELGGMDQPAAAQQRLVASSMALQNEDRVQQRLRDLRAALSVLERALNIGCPLVQSDIDHAIIDRLCLEEIRSAFAVSIGMADALSSSASPAKAPPVGDVDLF